MLSTNLKNAAFLPTLSAYPIITPDSRIFLNINLKFYSTQSKSKYSATTFRVAKCIFKIILDAHIYTFVYKQINFKVFLVLCWFDLDSDMLCFVPSALKPFDKNTYTHNKNILVVFKRNNNTQTRNTQTRNTQNI